MQPECLILLQYESLHSLWLFVQLHRYKWKHLQWFGAFKYSGDQRWANSATAPQERHPLSLQDLLSSKLQVQVSSNLQSILTDAVDQRWNHLLSEIKVAKWFLPLLTLEKIPYWNIIIYIRWKILLFYYFPKMFHRKSNDSICPHICPLSQRCRE